MRNENHTPGPQGYRHSTRLAGDVRNPDAYDGYVLSDTEYQAVLDRKRRGLGQWEKSTGSAARRQLQRSAA